MIVFMQPFSKLPTYDCLDTELLLEFSAKAFFGSLSFLNFAAGKLPVASELFPA